MFRSRPGIDKKLKSDGINLPTTASGDRSSGGDDAGGAASGAGASAGGDAAEQSSKPSDAVTLVFRVGCIVKKLFLCSKVGSVPLDEVE